MGRKIVIIAILLFSAIFVTDAQTGVWSGKLDVQGTKLTLVFHMDDDNPTVDSPDQGVKEIPVQIEGKGTGSINIIIPSLGASYKGVWLVRQIVGTFTQMNVSMPLTLTPGEDRPRRPQTPVGPFTYSTEDVSFANGDVVLNGTLVLPEGYSRETPALVMVTGSGQQNRDEEIFEHKPFAVIADALARVGVATLRYDDRGFSGYSGNIHSCTVDDFKDDALAGIDLLRKSFDNVGVIGHSEGGTIAIMLASEKKVDFIVSLAGMVVSGAETLLLQNRTALTDAGIPEAAVDQYCRLLAGTFDAIINEGPMPDADTYDIPEPLKRNYMAALQQIRTPYMSRFLSLDMRSLLDDVTCPVLALNGTKDIQVDCQLNLDVLRKGLNHNSMALVEPMDGLNHMFQHCTTGAVSEYREIEETIAPEVLQKISDWLSEFK